MRQAVISVGGDGTRLDRARPDAAKPTILIGDDISFLDIVIANVARHGVRDIILLAGHLGEILQASHNGRSVRDATVTVIREPPALGTAGALSFARDRLDDVFLMTNGNTLFDVNYLRLLSALQANDLAAIALRAIDNASRYANVEVADGRVIAFRDKDTNASGAPLISAGVYVMRRDILGLVDCSSSSLEADVFPKLVATGRIAGAPMDGYFFEIALSRSRSQLRSDLASVIRRPAIFFDRDGTLNLDSGYTHRPADLHWIEGAIDAIRRVNDAGWLAIVATNQAGVSRGFYTEGAVHLFHAHMQNELMRAGAHIDAFYHCPFHEAASIEQFRHPNHPDRKPNPGMLSRAIAEWNVDVSRSAMIGDRDSDIKAADAAGLAAIRYEQGSLAALVDGVLSRDLAG